MGDIDDLASQFRATQASALALVAPLSNIQVNWRAHAQAWSIAECVQHLTITARAVESHLRPAIMRGRDRGLTGAGPFTYGWFSRWFASEMEPPPKRRMKAPAVFAVVPGSTLDKVAVLHDFAASGTTWLELLEQSRGLDLTRVKTTSPASRILRFPLGAYYRISAAHERRHLWQAERIRAHSGFPSS